MGRIIFISHRHDDLVQTIIKKVPEAVALTSFKLEIQRGDVLCWLPTVNEYVELLSKRFQKRLRSLVLNLKFNVGMCCVGFLLLMSM